MKRINLCVTDEEVAMLQAVADWQETIVSGSKPLITAVAANCYRSGLKEAFAKTGSKNRKKSVRKPVKK